MTQITGGKVTYSEQQQPGTFGSPKAEVEISFSVAEGDDYMVIFNHAAAVAKRKAWELIERKAASVAAGVTAAAPPPPQPATPAAAAASGGKEAAAAAINAAEKPKKPRKAPDAAKPAEAAQPTKPDDLPPGSSAAPPAAADQIDFTALDAAMTPPAKKITDAELNHACQQKVASVAGKPGGEAMPQKVRAEIAKFAGPPPNTLKAIPAEKREEFLKALEAIA